MSSEEKPEKPHVSYYWNDALDLRIQQPTTSKRCVLSLIAQAKIFSPRFPISLLHSSYLSCTRRKPHLVWKGVHSAVCGERPKIHDFSKISGDVPLWKIVSRDLLGRFEREYACWKGHIAYFEEKI